MLHVAYSFLYVTLFVCVEVVISSTFVMMCVSSNLANISLREDKNCSSNLQIALNSLNVFNAFVIVDDLRLSHNHRI